MRYLRMLTNSLAGGLLAAAFLAVVVLQINPHLPLLSASAWRWFAILSIVYGAHLAAAFYVLIVLRQLLAVDVFSPGWASGRVLAWIGTVIAAAGAAVMWLNLRSFQAVLDAEAAGRMGRGAAAATIMAALLALLAVSYATLARRRQRAAAGLVVAAVIASVALPLAARGPARERTSGAHRFGASLAFGLPAAPPNVIMILLDGASLDYITPAAAEGRLPNLGRILDNGAAMHITTIRPTQPAPVWASVATGKLPYKSGVWSGATYRVRGDSHPVELLPAYCFSHVLVRFGFVLEVPHTSAVWRARPFWTILSDFGITVGIVRWPVTHPAQRVLGYLVSDRFHMADWTVGDDSDGVYPATWLALARQAVEEEPAGPVTVSLQPHAVPSAPVPDATDGMYARLAEVLQSAARAQVVAVRYQGLDAVAHRFYGYAMPRSFRGIPEEARRRYGHLVDEYYAYIDAEVGRAIDALDTDDLLLVVSGFGMAPVSDVKRLAGRIAGQEQLTGTHEDAPDGFLLAYGSRVAPGRLPLGSLVDVVPTVLYYLGLPVARDMDGHARTDVFDRSFTAERPITFIPTYER